MHIVSFILERLCCVIVYGHGSLMVQTIYHSPLPLAFHLLHHAFSLVTVLWIAYAERLYDSRAVYKNDFVQLDKTTVIPVERNCAENPWINKQMFEILKWKCVLLIFLFTSGLQYCSILRIQKWGLKSKCISICGVSCIDYRVVKLTQIS